MRSHLFRIHGVPQDVSDGLKIHLSDVIDWKNVMSCGLLERFNSSYACNCVMKKPLRKVFSTNVNHRISSQGLNTRLPLKGILQMPCARDWSKGSDIFRRRC